MQTGSSCSLLTCVSAVSFALLSRTLLYHVRHAWVQLHGAGSASLCASRCSDRLCGLTACRPARVQEEDTLAEVCATEAVPDFRVQCLDVWHNATGSWSGLTVRVKAECEALQPSTQEFAVDASGIAEITGTRGPCLHRPGDQLCRPGTSTTCSA